MDLGISIEAIRDKKAFICDMDGVIYHGNRLLPGVGEFVAWLQGNRKDFLFLTNNSGYTPGELRHKLSRMGMDVPESHFYTSAQATAAFLASQKPNGSAYVIGQTGMVKALYDVGYSMNDIHPDYVVIGEGDDYTYAKIIRAVRLVRAGAKLIGTNPDVTGPAEGGIVPATAALVAPVELATGAKAYYVGKPNPLMMRNALKKLGARREDTAIIGDRMDTDIIAGIESEIATVLVLSGVTSPEDIGRFAYRPDIVLNGVGEIAATARVP